MRRYYAAIHYIASLEVCVMISLKCASLQKPIICFQHFIFRLSKAIAITSHWINRSKMCYTTSFHYRLLSRVMIISWSSAQPTEDTALAIRKHQVWEKCVIAFTMKRRYDGIRPRIPSVAFIYSRHHLNPPTPCPIHRLRGGRRSFEACCSASNKL